MEAVEERLTLSLHSLDATAVISACPCAKAHTLDKSLAKKSTVHLGLTGQESTHSIESHDHLKPFD